uniref:Uncharacterized protein n=1 Tax=Bionectria ochroleuca TaxID=29856 RepID=A0A8H7K6R4_BIOOC
MDKSQVSTAQGYLTLTSKPVTGQPPAHHGGKDIPINYLSGAIHAKKTFTVQAGGGFDFSADFLAPVDKGMAPEIDVAEWKGSGDISFNTFNTSSQVTARDVPYSNPKAWHTVRTEIRDANGRDVSVSFYLDNKWVATQYGSNYVDAGLYFIINYQMEGSSGSPGPSTTTTYSVRNVKVISYNP